MLTLVTNEADHVARSGADLGSLAAALAGEPSADATASDARTREDGDNRDIRSTNSDEQRCVRADIRSCEDAAALGRFFAEVLRVEHEAVACSPTPSCAGMSTVRVLTVCKGSLDTVSFMRLCSALPYARSVQTLRLEDDQEDTPQTYHRFTPWSITRFHFDWLMYAVFHPKSASSSLRRLELSDVQLGNGAKETLELMRTNAMLRLATQHRTPTLLASLVAQDVVSGDLDASSHLALVSATKLAALTMPVRRKKRKLVVDVGADDLADTTNGNGMLLVRVKANTTVRLKADASSQTLVTLQTESELEVCERTSDGQTEILVLVPGYGFGWVNSADVCEFAPSNLPLTLTPVLTALDVCGSTAGTKVALLLHGLGEPLQSLAVRLCVLSATFFSDIDQACPNLRVLEVTETPHPASSNSVRNFFKHPTRRLEQLTLEWDLVDRQVLGDILSQAHAFPVARFLKELRFTGFSAYAYRFSYRRSLGQLAQGLAKNTAVERISFRTRRGAFAVSDREKFERDLGNGVVVAKASTVQAHAALLSVQRRKCREMSRDVLQLIFAFAIRYREVRFEQQPMDE